MKIERDRADVTGGVRHGRTLGGPIALQVANRDFANWEERMNPWPVEAEVAEVHLPRPGHADLVGTWKYRLTDVRNVLERASARETAARVAGGALAKAFLRALGVEVRSHVVQIGSVRAPARDAPLRVAGLRGRRRRSRALPGPRGEPRDGRPHQRPAQGQRVAGRRVRGGGLRRDARARVAHQLGEPPRRAPDRRDVLDPGREGRRRSATPSTSRGVRAPRPTTRSSSATSAASIARRNHAGGLEGGMTHGRAASSCARR